MNGRVKWVGRASLSEPRHALCSLLPFHCPSGWAARDPWPDCWTTPVARGSVLKRRQHLKRTVATSLFWRRRRTPWLVRADWPVRSAGSWRVSLERAVRRARRRSERRQRQRGKSEEEGVLGALSTNLPGFEQKSVVACEVHCCVWTVQYERKQREGERAGAEQGSRPKGERASRERGSVHDDGEPNEATQVRARVGAAGSSRPKDRVARIQSSASRLDEAGTGGKLAAASRERSRFETRIGGMPARALICEHG